jgi:carbon starvation protein
LSLTLLAVGFLLMLAAAYRLYGGWVARQFQLDDSRPTPAREVNDGVDFAPTRPFYLFGQHFSAIAAAGPIAGPILACQAFGWLPCLLWIGLGVVLIGAVHDFTSLAASVRHGATSVADITREYLGRRAGRAMMAFIWIALVYVIVAFADITAGTFVGGSEELRATSVGFNPGGAVAAASIMYLVLSVVLGFVQKYLEPPLWLVTVVFVPAVFALSWAGTYVSNLFVLDHRTWGLLILAYCAVASMVPMWSLLQPRGYLGGFVLYTALALGIIGVFFGGYEIAQPAFKGFFNERVGMTGALFPFLFVTIACGACSGFHGLVCSGTTSKQVEKESHVKPIGYGAMLAEGFVALVALVTIMIVAQSDIKPGTAPGTIYGNGIGRFLTLIVGEGNLAFATTFGAMAFSTFVFDTLDVSTRLGRYIVQELVGWRTRAGALAGTLLTVAVPMFFIALAPPDSYRNFWTLFGASNQLLAALTLLTITVWLYQARQRIAYTLVPMLFVLAITLWALGGLVLGNLRSARGLDVSLVNALASAALVVLAVYLSVLALVRVRRSRRGGTLVPAHQSAGLE